MENCFVRICNHTNSAIQLYRGKNSSDSAIIDAMDLLYSDKVDGFCIVSSDSDFTRLAIRLRESGMKVIGMGRKTPNSFIVACDRFIYIEVLDGAIQKKAKTVKLQTPKKPAGKRLKSRLKSRLRNH
jgi:hypothetical protein